tara:strand:- start:5925 stop:6455 length:531 start_codon:yes stop_codon:yes gene_type:complete
MKNLTENQTNLVNKMVSEFERLNAEKPKVEVQNSAIDLLFDKANDYHIDKSDFYEDIRDNNKVIINLSYYKMLLLTNQVKHVFREYNLTFLENKDCLQIMVKEKDNSWIVLSFRISYITTYVTYNRQSNKVCSHSNFDIIIDTKIINHENLLECPVFLQAVENMFLKYPQIKKINN